MTIYFAGTELDVTSSQYSASSSFPNADTSYSRISSAVSSLGPSEIYLTSDVGAESASGVWVHARVYYSSTVNDADSTSLIALYDGSSNLAFSVSSCVNGVMQFSVYNTSGSSGASGDWDSQWNDSLKFLDIHVYTEGGTAKADVYADSVLVASASVAGSNRGTKQIKFGSLYYSNTFWSEWIVSDTDTRGLRVITAYPSSDGAHTDGTGGYANIDESGSTDSNEITLTSVGDKQSYNATKVGTHSTDLYVHAVCVGGRVNSDGTNDMQALLRISGADYNGPDLGLSASPVATCTVWDTNPATSSAWGTLADLPALEAGFEVVA